MPILLALTAIMKAWMAVDATQRCRGSCSWLWIIVAVPLGEWAYFFMVKMNDPAMMPFKQKFLASFQNRPTLEHYRYQAEHSPSISNRLILAKALIDEGSFSEAAPIAEAILKSDPKDRDALYVSGIAALGLNETERAVKIFTQLNSIDYSYKDYSVVLERADALWKLERYEEAFPLLRDLVSKTHRIQHKYELAKRYTERGMKSEATLTLDEIRRDYDHAPRYIQRNSRATLRDATRLFTELKKSESKISAS